MTRTFVPNGNGGTTSGCTPASGANKELLTSTTDTTNISRDVPASTSDEISVSWTTQTTQPASADWPAASAGDPYRVNLNYSVMAADVSVKHSMHRVNASCTSQDSVTSGTLSGAGTKEYNNDTWNSSAGASTDRAQVRVLGSNGDTMMARSFTINIASVANDVRGPWAAAGTAYVGIVNETEAVTESVDPAAKFNDAVNETEAVTEGTVTLKQINLPVNETETVTEGLVAPLGFIRVVSETEAVTEADVTLKGILSPANETETVSEGTVTVATYVRAAGETEAVTEGVATAATYVRVVDETEAVTEAVTGPRAITASVPSPVGIVQVTEVNTVHLQRNLKSATSETEAIQEGVVSDLTAVSAPQSTKASAVSQRVLDPLVSYGSLERIAAQRIIDLAISTFSLDDLVSFQVMGPIDSSLEVQR